jgi:hypothetical protein
MGAKQAPQDIAELDIASGSAGNVIDNVRQLSPAEQFLVGAIQIQLISLGDILFDLGKEFTEPRSPLVKAKIRVCLNSRANWLCQGVGCTRGGGKSEELAPINLAKPAINLAKRVEGRCGECHCRHVPVVPIGGLCQ